MAENPFAVRPMFSRLKTKNIFCPKYRVMSCFGTKMLLLSLEIFLFIERELPTVSGSQLTSNPRVVANFQTDIG